MVRQASQPTTYPTATTIAGQRRQVYEGRALKTRGGLTRKDLKKSKSGKIVSRKASDASKRTFAKNGLSKYSYTPDPNWLSAL